MQIFISGGNGDMNEEDHNRLQEKIDKLIWTEPENLLPGNKHLLDEDFDTLSRASAMDKILWVAEMEASIATVNQGRTTNKDSEQADDATTGTNTATQARTDPNTGARQQWRKKGLEEGGVEIDTVEVPQMWLSQPIRQATLPG